MRKLFTNKCRIESSQVHEGCAVISVGTFVSFTGIPSAGQEMQVKAMDMTKTMAITKTMAVTMTGIVEGNKREERASDLSRGSQDGLRKHKANSSQQDATEGA